MVKKNKIGLLMQGDSNWIGGIIYIQNLVKALNSLPVEKKTNIKVYLFISPTVEAKFYKNLSDLVEEIDIKNCLKASFVNRLIWKVGRTIPQFKDKRLAKLIKEKKIDFLYPIYPISNSLGISCDFTCNWSSWIPDFQHQHLPYFFSNKEIKGRDRVFKYMADYAPNLILSSNNALRDFKKIYPDSKCRTHVLNFRTIPEPEWFKDEVKPYQTQKKYNLPDNFFLVSNQFWVHKNHKVIIEALSILKQKKINPVVVCTGKLYDSRFPKYGDEILGLIETQSLHHQFIILGLIPRLDQIQLMRRSLAVIQPSLFEGWSTVVEDARVLGKVMILSDIPVHIEQNPPDASFFKRSCSQELSHQIESLLPKLIPGPNLTKESKAREKNILECQTYGEKFIDIIQNSIGNMTL